MNRRFLVLIGSAAIAIAGALFLSRQPESPNAEVAHASSERDFVWKEQNSAGLCPWRSPDADRKRFFAGSTGYEDQTLILTRERRAVEQKLGRIPTGDENALIVHRIQGSPASPGVVVTRRVRGESGVIEMVLAVDAAGTVQGAEIQRLREPEPVAQVLRSQSWLGSFRGKNSASAWELGRDVAPVPPPARPCAEAIVRETRTVLILLDVATHSATALAPATQSTAHHHSG